MPMSSHECLVEILDTILLLQPRSVLDVGAGFGKYGVLLREYLEVWHGRYSRDQWQVTVDMVEAFAPYVSPWHHMFYDQVFIGDAQRLVPTLGPYDAVLCIDVVEHLPLAEVEPFLRTLSVTARLVVVTTPVVVRQQDAFMGNQFERHRSQVTSAMLRRAGAGVVRRTGGTRVAYFAQDPALSRRLFGLRARLGRHLRGWLAAHDNLNAFVHAVSGKRVWIPPRLSG